MCVEHSHADRLCLAKDRKRTNPMKNYISRCYHRIWSGSHTHTTSSPLPSQLPFFRRHRSLSEVIFGTNRKKNPQRKKIDEPMNVSHNPKSVNKPVTLHTHTHLAAKSKASARWRKKKENEWESHAHRAADAMCAYDEQREMRDAKCVQVWVSKVKTTRKQLYDSFSF